MSTENLNFERVTAKPAAPAWPHCVHVMLPAYNEQDSLPPLLDAIRSAMEAGNLRYLVTVVDDGSSDDTALVASQASFHMPVELVPHEVNQGLAAALRTGIAAVLRRCEPGDVVVTMDSDNTHPPHLIHGMLKEIDAGRDIVIASRYRRGASVNGVPAHRNWLSLGARYLFQIAFPTRGVRDFTCGYRAYRADVLRRASRAYGDNLITETGFSCMADLLLKLRRMGVSMGEVPIELHYDRRGTGSKMRVMRTVGQTLWLIVKFRFHRVPMLCEPIAVTTPA